VVIGVGAPGGSQDDGHDCRAYPSSTNYRY
jgi:hypothetical protein